MTVTFRGEKTLLMDGNMFLAPISVFELDLQFELSHFELDIGGKHYIVRYNLHRHLVLQKISIIKGQSKIFLISPTPTTIVMLNLALARK
jgi:hypothetical protein